MGLFDFFQPPPQECPAPITLPESLQDLLPPVPEPEPELEPPDYRAAAAAAAALIAQSLQDDEECKECDPCKAVAFGKEYVRSYGDIRTARVGYEYQHHVVNWFFHDPVNRFIMEWELGGVKFDGLDPEEGAKLAIRAIARPECDPTFTSHCYLIDTKYGYANWFRYDAYEDQWEPVAPSFLLRSLLEEMQRQDTAFKVHYPNVALVWICSFEQLRDYLDESVIPQVSSIRVRSVYYPYTAIEDRS